MKALLLFLHGLGSSGRSFRRLAAELADLEEYFEFVFPDFYGFGNRPIPQSIDRVSIDAFSRQMIDEIQARMNKERRDVHVIGHSMGGAVVVEAHRICPTFEIGSFISLEGNLSLDDCTSSKEVAAQDRSRFCLEGFQAFRESIRNAASQGDIAAQDWVNGLDRTTAEVFYDASSDLVRLSDMLYPTYRDWDTRSLYVYGERTLSGPLTTHDRLKKDGKNVAVIPGAGHLMLIERAVETALVCRGHLVKL